jgi:hypothetical protein
MSHIVRVFHHIAVSEAHRLEAGLSEVFVAEAVPNGLGVLPSIQFNDQPCFEADEIEDVAIRWDLPLELQSAQPPTA